MATICIPAAGGVPSAPGPPNFVQDFTVQPSFMHDTDIIDPRWQGSLRVTFGGANEMLPMGSALASFRALYQNRSDGQNFLYFIWRQTADMALDPSSDEIFVGFRFSTNYGRVFRISSYTTTAEVMAQKTFAVSSAYTFAPGAGFTLDSAAPADTHWSVVNTRNWLIGPNDPSTREWAIAMRVPLAQSNEANGVPFTLGDPFSLFFCVNNYNTFASSIDSNLFQSAYPQTALVDLSSPLGPQLPDESLWATFQAGGTATCQQGISLDPADILVAHPSSADDDQVHLIATNTAAQNQLLNTFKVSFMNATGATTGAVGATFRLANWGTQGNIDNPDTWHQVAAGTTSGTPDDTKGTILAPWDLADLTAHQQDYPPFPSAIRLPHLCMLVELEADNTLFSNDSAYQNMNFDTASLLEADAEVGVRGIGPDPFGSSHRTVYLFVQAHNMPVVADPADQRLRDLGSMLWRSRGDLSAVAGSGSGSGNGNGNGSGSGSGSGNGLDLGLVESPFDVLNQFVPTYRVRAFHETGKFVTFKGKRLRLLESQTSFGVYLDHQGALTGWDHQIAGADLVAPNLWRVRVPNNGAARVKVRILAKENATDSLNHGQDALTTDFDKVCLFAKSSLTVSDRVTVTAAGGAPTTIASAGTINVGTDTKIGNVVSASSVQLRDRAHVNGSILSGQGVSLGNSVQITGSVTSQASLRLPNLNLQPAFPATNAGAINLDPATRRTLPAGAYGVVSVKSRATLTLSAGTYFFDSFGIEPQAVVALTSGTAQVIIYVRNDCTIRGTFTNQGGVAPNLFIGVFGGMTQVSLEVPFTGTLVVPNGTLQLATVPSPGFTGAFFASNLIVQPGSAINFVSFAGPPALNT
jgi:hypothetical protein